MIVRLLTGFISVLFLSYGCVAGNELGKTAAEQHIEVSMRMIGHQILLNVADSTSRVLPIEKTGDGYLIRFEADFSFNPESLAATIDSVIAATQIATRYIVAVESCEKQQVVHMYEVGKSDQTDVLACKARDQPKDCYLLRITILDPIAIDTVNSDLAEVGARTSSNESSIAYVLLAALALVIIAGSVAVSAYSRKKASATMDDPNVIQIGEYRFSKQRMELSFKGERVELTSKECDLLQLLCDSNNDTVERETILKMVWGDEGDYVGRTLDVFISKLRKKLEADPRIKIVNVRGVGYKLMLQDQA